MIAVLFFNQIEKRTRSLCELCACARNNNSKPGIPNQLEELAQFLLSIYFFNQLAFAWWWLPALILLPDLGMIGYLKNPKAGAIFYNFVHHKAVAIGCWGIGVYLNNPPVQLAGIILFAHSSMDRMMGYGLKYNDGFNNTHLGIIGKNIE